MPNTTALVSAYYCAGFLHSRIENLLTQSVVPQILCVCQDGSQEHALLKRYPVTIITTPNIPTLYSAWNIGVCASTTTFLTSANSDDLFEKRGIEILESIMEGYEIGVGRCKIYNQRINKTRLELKQKNITYKKMLKSCSVGAMPIWRRDLHLQYGYFRPDFRVCGDYEFWLRCLLHGTSIRTTDEIVGTFVIRSKSLSHSKIRIITEERKLLRLLYKIR